MLLKEKFDKVDSRISSLAIFSWAQDNSVQNLVKLDLGVIPLDKLIVNCATDYEFLKLKDLNSLIDGSLNADPGSLSSNSC